MKIKIRHSRPTISSSEINAVSKVLKSGYIASGEATKDFEGKFTRLIKVRSCVAANSGTSALHLALLALKIEKNDEVIIPSFVCTSLLDALLYIGAEPKIADISPVDFNLSLKDAKKKISRKTKAIILAHMFGKPADMSGFLKLGIPLVEDCAQSLGGRYNGRPAGGFGDVSIFSFYATKVIATGYGGMVCSRNKDLIRRIRDLIEVDERDNYKVRFNYKMSDIAASLGMTQLERLDGFVSGRRSIAGYYNRNLKSKSVLIPVDKEKEHIYYRYVIRIKGDISKVIYALNEKGIEVKRPIFKPLHRYFKLNKEEFPITEAVYNSAISLPIYPSLKRSEAKFIVETVNEVIG